MAEKASERQKAELRDVSARARLEYEAEKKARRAFLRLAPETPKDPTAFQLVGDMAEMVTLVEECAADWDDPELSNGVHALRQAVTRVGNTLARRKRAYGGET